MMKVNRIKCLECNEILESIHVHDFKSCSCKNESFVDGGRDYQRVGGFDLSKIARWNYEKDIFESLEQLETMPEDELINIIQETTESKNVKHVHVWNCFRNTKNYKLYQCLKCFEIKNDIINKDTNFDLNFTNIWHYRQNKPTLIVDDFEQFGVDRKVSHFILLARGVYKWFSVRRKLIKIKNDWKDRILDAIDCIKVAKKDKDYYSRIYFKGYLRALEECRKEIRELCHSDRWQAPDFDKEANEYLRGLKNEDN